jgi:predicted MPP superfamily phosphohydrolase
MILHILSALMFFYLLFRVILPRRTHWGVKALAAVFLLLASQMHFFYRNFFGTMASPELPAPLLLLLSGAFMFIFIFFLALLLHDFITLALAPFRRRVRRPFSPGRRQALLAGLTLIPVVYGLRQAVAVPEIRELEAPLSRLPLALDGFTLVQVSDLHVSSLLHGPRVRAVVEKINALAPDLVVFTGDLVDGFPARRAESMEALRHLRARYGVFACTGNHEYYSDYRAWMRTLPRLGLNMLLNEHVILNVNGEKLLIAGVTDVAAERYALPLPDVAAALAGAPASGLRILLEHRPIHAAQNAQYGFDLQLSGHTHGGQIWGINRLVAELNQGYLYGWYQEADMRLYVSSGAGLWNGFPLRFGVPSEIVCMKMLAARQLL